jgi:allantoin racemase
VKRRIGYCTATSGYTAEEQARRAAILARWVPSDVELEQLAIPSGPAFLDQRSDFDKAVDAAVSFIRSIDPTKYDVIISAGAIDPGLDGLRANTSIPVVGPGEASMFVAHALGLPLSIVTVDEHAVAKSHEMLAHTALKPPIASVRSIGYPVRRTVQDLDGARAALRRECGAAVRDDGARAIYLGAMTLGTLGLDDTLRSELGVAILDPVQIAIGTAVQLLRTL